MHKCVRQTSSFFPFACTSVHHLPINLGNKLPNVYYQSAIGKFPSQWVVSQLMSSLSDMKRDSRTLLHERNKMGAIHETATFLKGTFKGEKKQGKLILII